MTEDTITNVHDLHIVKRVCGHNENVLIPAAFNQAEAKIALTQLHIESLKPCRLCSLVANEPDQAGGGSFDQELFEKHLTLEKVQAYAIKMGGIMPDQAQPEGNND